METRASYVLVGVFVILLVASGFAITIWFTRAQFAEAPDRYVVNFRGSVTGLQVGSTVRYRGIPVGTVATLRIDRDNVEIIRAVLELEPGTPIKTDTYAQLSIQGITGVAFVQLDGGTSDSPRLTARDDQMPEIPSRVSGLETVLNKAPELLDRLVTIADRLSEVLADGNVAAITQTLDNLRRITDAFAAQSGQVDRQFKEVGEAVTAMRRVAASTERLMQQLEARVGPLSTSTEQTLAEVRKTAQSFAKLSNELTTLTADNRAALSDFSSQGLYEFTQFLIEARQLVAGLNRLAGQIERSPTGFLFGDSQKGYEAR